MNIKGLRLLQRSLPKLQEYYEEIGLCNHSIGIYSCVLDLLIKDIKQYITDWSVERCSDCKRVIRKDQSYIQNCDGVQHLDCYWSVK